MKKTQKKLGQFTSIALAISKIIKIIEIAKEEDIPGVIKDIFENLF